MAADKKERLQNIGIVVVTALIAIVMIWANTYKRMGTHFKEAEEFYSQGEYLKAITSYETAIHAYVPWSSKIKQSAQRLWEIGNMYEEKGEADYALIAYRSLRSSFYAVRSFYQPYPEWIAKCDEKIPPLMDLQEIQYKKLTEAPALAPQ